jgi:hypothetical protein
MPFNIMKISADTQISARKVRVGFGAFLLKASLDNCMMSVGVGITAPFTPFGFALPPLVIQ